MSILKVIKRFFTHPIRSCRLVRSNLAKDFSWKLRMRMKYDRNPLLVTLQDKWAIKAYAIERGVQVARLLHVTEDPRDIPFDDLPQTCFIKANHGCRWNIAKINGQLYRLFLSKHLWASEGILKPLPELEPYLLSQDKCIELCRQWLQSRHLDIEWAYQHISPKIIVEEWLTSTPEIRISQYALYVINGKVSLIRKWFQDDIDFSRNWEPLGQFAQGTQVSSPLPDCPPEIPAMIEVAENLAADIDMLRVDLADTEDGPKLIEIAVYPASWLPLAPTTHHPTNVWLGTQWQVDQTHFTKKIKMRND